jgi:hypothetical protein
MSAVRSYKTPSELDSWRSSDELPEDTQGRIHRLLVDAIEDMNHLDRTIEGVLSNLLHLKQQQEAGLVRISILRSAISSAKKIPPEIMILVLTDLYQLPVCLPLTKHSVRQLAMLALVGEQSCGTHHRFGGTLLLPKSAPMVDLGASHTA